MTIIDDLQALTGRAAVDHDGDKIEQVDVDTNTPGTGQTGTGKNRR